MRVKGCGHSLWVKIILICPMRQTLTIQKLRESDKAAVRPPSILVIFLGKIPLEHGQTCGHYMRHDVFSCSVLLKM